MNPTITTDIRTQLAELAARAEQRDLAARELDRTHVTTFRSIVPAHWASPLLYNDYTGLWDEEVAEIKSHLNQLRSIHKAPIACVSIDEHSEFAWRNDANNLGGPTITATFHISPRLGFPAQA